MEELKSFNEFEKLNEEYYTEIERKLLHLSNTGDQDFRDLVEIVHTIYKIIG